MKKLLTIVLAVAAFAAGYAARDVASLDPAVQAQAANRVFELRTYTAPDGKLADLQARFRNHTLRIFERHGMTNIGYWIPQDDPLKQNTIVYLLAHRSRDAAKQSWAAFGADPEWRTVAAESQVNGRIVANVVSVFLDPADFSPIK
jgi:hypothetical protein